MGIIALIVLGGLAGWIASVVMRTNSNQNTVGDVLLGIVGALVGGMIMNFFGQTGVTGFNFYSLVVAIIGSVALIGVGRMIYR